MHNAKIKNARVIAHPSQSTMTPSGIDRVARALLAARRDQSPSDATLLADALSSSVDAYAVQALVARSVAPQQTVFPRYWKSGGPSREAALTHAALPPQGIWPSPADARSWAFNVRLIEAEIALRLARDVSPADADRLTPEAAATVVNAMTVSIELVDSRWKQGVAAPALLKLADLQSHGALVLGPWVPFVPRDWAAQSCTVRIGGQPAVLRRGTHSMGDPAWLLPAWLRHATREGQTVPAGTVVTTGTWCGVLPAAAGDLVIVRFEGVGEASVQL
jgi:2-keto-4-pentenoate hydratase